MNNLAIKLIVLGFFIIISILDLKAHKMPAFLTSAMILVLCVMNYDNILFGVIAGVFGLLLMELKFYSGIADLKSTIILGLMMNNFNSFFIFMLMLMFFGVIYKIVVKLSYKYADTDYVAFVPLFLFVFIGMWVGGII